MGFNPHDPLVDASFPVSLLPCADNLRNRDIGIGSAVFEVFHELLLLEVVCLEEGIPAPIEFQRRNPVPLAEFLVKGGRGLDPFILEMELHEAMIDKKVGPDELDQLPGRQVISDSGEPQAGRDSTGPAQRTEERSLGDTIGSTSFENLAGLVVLGQMKRGIGIVKDAVANRQEESHRLVNRVDAPSNDASREVHNSLVVAVDDGSGGEIGVEFSQVGLHN